MAILKRELEYVLGTIEAELPQGGAAPASADRALPDGRGTKELLEKLAGLLMADSAEVLYLLEDLRRIPEAKALARQVGQFDFDAALKTLGELRESLGD